MKRILAFALLIAGSAAVHAQATADSDTVNNARMSYTFSVRDGFTRANGDTLMTYKGVTRKVNRDVMLNNGLRMAPNGNAVLPNGQRIFLNSNQILTFDGNVDITPLLPSGVAPLGSGGTASTQARPDVGMYVRDGITGTNNSAFITQNGYTLQVTSDIHLDSGILVQSNGNITLANGTRVTLRPGQLLTFDGALEEYTQPR
jgi:hypothetical protein